MNVTPQQLCDEIMNLLQTMKAGFADIAEAQGLTKTQLMALSAIHMHGEVPMGQMADILHCDASNVTGIVDRMVNHNLIIRKECPGDRRAKQLALTPKGDELVNLIKAKLPGMLGCDKLSAADRAAIHQILHKMHDTSSTSTPAQAS